MSDGPHAIISRDELRQRFNEGGYVERLERGILTAHEVANNHPSAPLAQEPFCTASQLIEYRTAAGTPVAIVHQYLRPDGTLGLSGLPDPKMILDRGVLYYLDEP
ncbi:MAG: hypothetical protein NVSMB52_20290 [Chloroflexota bacterium]